MAVPQAATVLELLSTIYFPQGAQIGPETSTHTAWYRPTDLQLSSDRLPHRVVLSPTLNDDLEKAYQDLLLLQDPAKLYTPPSDYILHRWSDVVGEWDAEVLEGHESNYGQPLGRLFNFAFELARLLEPTIAVPGHKRGKMLLEASTDGGTRDDYRIYVDGVQAATVEMKTVSSFRMHSEGMMAQAGAEDAEGRVVGTELPKEGANHVAMLLKLCISLTMDPPYGPRFGCFTDLDQLVFARVHYLDTSLQALPQPEIVLGKPLPFTTQSTNLLKMMVFALLLGLQPHHHHVLPPLVVAPPPNAPAPVSRLSATRSGAYGPGSGPSGGSGGGRGAGRGGAAPTVRGGWAGGNQRVALLGSGSVSGRGVWFVGEARESAILALFDSDCITIRASLKGYDTSAEHTLHCLPPSRSDSPTPSSSTFSSSTNDTSASSSSTTITIISGPFTGASSRIFVGHLGPSTALKIALKYARGPNHWPQINREAFFYTHYLSRLSSPALLRYFGVWTDDVQRRVLILEEGGRAIDEFRELDATQKASLLALFYELHRAGVQHNDLRPANILLNGNGRVSLIDFGEALTHECTGADLCGELIAARQVFGSA